MARTPLTPSVNASPDELARADSGPVESPMPNGAAVAAILAAAIGSAVLGLIIPLSEAIPVLKTVLNWWNPAGPLVGKTSVSVIAYFVSWFILHRAWADRDIAFDQIWKISLILFAIGFIGTFPLFFELFTH